MPLIAPNCPQYKKLVSVTPVTPVTFVTTVTTVTTVTSATSATNATNATIIPATNLSRFWGMVFQGTQLPYYIKSMP